MKYVLVLMLILTLSGCCGVVDVPDSASWIGEVWDSSGDRWVDGIATEMGENICKNSGGLKSLGFGDGALYMGCVDGYFIYLPKTGDVVSSN